MPSRLPVRFLGVFLALVLDSTTAQAHHSRAGYDATRQVSVSGVVEKFFWASPHIYVQVAVADEAGESTLWQLEGNSPAVLRTLEWDRDVLKPGMAVTATGKPAVNSDRKMILFDTIELLDSGRRLYSNETLYLRSLAGEASSVAVEPSVDFQGIWERELKVPPTEAGVFDPPTDFPVTPAGQELLDSYAAEENPALYCLPLGVPRGLNYAYGLQIRREGDQLIFDKELRPDDRIVHLGQAEFPEEIEPSVWGYAIGDIDGDTLTVHSRGFSPDKWGIAIGLDSSSQKEVTEQWRLVEDGMGIEVEFIVSDPVYLAEPVTIELFLRKQADRALAEDPCDLEQAARYLGEGF